jgi:hypothetical protein
MQRTTSSTTLYTALCVKLMTAITGYNQVLLRTDAYAYVGYDTCNSIISLDSSSAAR